MSGGPSLELLLGDSDEVVRSQVESWVADEVPRRLLAHDPTLWFDDEVPELGNRMGWLDLPSTPEEVLGDWAGFGAAEREAGIHQVVVLGMGGSSLAPEVFERTFGTGSFLRVLDTTHPDTIREAASSLDPEGTLFVVSSKSGSTIETRTLMEYFWAWAGQGGRDAGRHFVAVTDPGSGLEKLATSRRMHRIFRTPPEVGGRYSALTAFGLVPAALSGVDIRQLVSRAGEASSLLAAGERSAPLLSLGAALGHLARAGRDKLTVVTSAELASFPDWLEQLVAESTGKHGRGVVPVLGESLRDASAYGDDRFFVGLLLESDSDGELEQALRRLAREGHPVAVIRLRDAYDLGYEIFRWEVAVALSGAVLGINPFDQPDVQLAKKMAQLAIEGGGDLAEALSRVPSWSPVEAGSALKDWLPRGAPRYLGLQAFVPPTPSMADGLAALQRALASTGCAITTGFGPRFLHSTGQLHKGGPAEAYFIQFVGSTVEDTAIPGEEISFGELIAAQADGDAVALLERRRELVRIRVSAASELLELAERIEEGP